MESINKIDQEISEFKKNYHDYRRTAYPNTLSEMLSYSNKIIELRFIEVNNQFNNDLRNVDVILDFLKVTLSVSSSIFIASKTIPQLIKADTNYVVGLLFIQMLFLIFFLVKRGKINKNFNSELNRLTNLGINQYSKNTDFLKRSADRYLDFLENENKTIIKRLKSMKKELSLKTKKT